MPTVNVQGIGKINFPEGTKQEVIDSTVKKLIVESQAKSPRSFDTEAQKNDRALAEETPSPALVAAGRGFMDTGQGLKQLMMRSAPQQDRISGALANQGMDPIVKGIDPATIAQFEERVGDELKQFQKLQDVYPGQTAIGRTAGNVASMPIPGAGQGATIPARLATAAGANALATASQFVPEGQSRLGNAAVGAVVGAAGQGLLGEPIRALTNKTVNARALAPEVQQIINAGKREGVPIYADDLAKSGFTKSIGTIVDQFGPLGTAPGRRKQNEAAIEAANRWAARVKGSHEIADIAGSIQGGFKDKLERFQAIKTRKYAKVSRLADQSGEVPLTKFNQNIDAAIADAQSRGIANPELVGFLQKVKAAPKGNFTTVNALDDDIGAEIAQYYTGDRSAIGSKGVQYLKQVKGALREDIDGFLSAKNPNAYRAWKDADGFYIENILPFRKTRLSKIVSDQGNMQPEMAYRYIESVADSPKMQKVLYNSLNDEGRASVKAGLMRDALEQAMTSPQSGGKKVLSTQKLSTYLEDRVGIARQYMKPEEFEQFNGFIKLMSTVQRSGQYLENPPTGQRVILPLLAGGFYFNPKGAATAAGGALMTKFLFQSPSTRNILIAASKTPANDPKMARLAKSLASTLASRSAAMKLTEPDVSVDTVN